MIKPPPITLRPPSHRSLLIDAMRSLALSKGFPATTVDEVCERANVTKGSFYHHFGSKGELGAAALRAYYDDVVAAMTGGSWAAEADPVARLHAFVRHAAEVLTGPVMAGGCLLGSFALDRAESEPDVRAELSGMFTELRDTVAGVIEAAGGAAVVEVDAAGLAEAFLVVVEGSIVLAKAHAELELRSRAMLMFGEHLRLVVGG